MPKYPETHNEEFLRREYIEKGKSLQEIADDIGATSGAVYAGLQRFDIETRSPGDYEKDPEDYRIDWYDTDEMIRLYTEEEYSCAAIAEELGCGEETVRSRLEKEGIERRPAVPDRTGPEHPNWAGGHNEYYGETWPAQRRAALNRDGHTCQACGLDGETHRERFGTDLHVHHIRPLREFEDTEAGSRLSNLITLCQTCHSRWEGIPLAPQLAPQT